MPLRRPRNAHANGSPSPASPASPSSPPSLSYTSTPFLYSPSSPSTTSVSPSAPYSPSTPPSHSQHSFQASPPSTFITQPQVRSRGKGLEEMFDPFSNAPRPRRKPYSPFSAFEAKSERPSSGQTERPMSTGSTYSYDAESVDQNAVEHSARDVDARNGQAQGREATGNRRSTLSFEIGGPEDETDTDREVSTPAHQVQPHEVSRSEPEAPVQAQGEYLSVGRPSTGDSTPSSQEVEPDSHTSSRDEDSGVASSADAEVEEERENASDLAPPRPRFLADAAERASWSSQDSSLYPPSSAPNSDTELVGGAGTTSDSDREAMEGKNVTNGGERRVLGKENIASTPLVLRQYAYRRRSGSRSSVNGGNNMNGGRALPPGAAPLNPQEQLHNQGQVPTRQGAYPTSRRYSGGAHRRSASGAAVPAATALASTTAAGVGEVVVNQEMEKGHAANSGSETLAPGPRTKKAAPPSSYRGSRTSFSGPGTGSSTNVAEDAHPLSPNPSEDPNSPHPNTNVNGEAPSSVGHGSIVSATSNQNISAAASAAMYAHQYPHSPVGYQYPPSPPPVGSPVSPHAAYVSVPGAGYTSTMPGYTPAGQPIVYPNVPAPGHFVNGIPVGGSGYATPVPRGPPPHNAFMANSAIARSSLSASVSGSAVDLVPYAARMNGTAVGQSRRNSIDVGGFAPPQPPFAQGAYPPSSPGTPGTPELRHAGSLPRLREPFLSPASRRSSTVWQPPTPAMYTASNVGYEGGDGRGGSGIFGGYGYNGVGSGSNTMLALPGKKEPLPSSALQRKISMSEKPWMRQRQKGERAAWWVTFCIMWIGIAVGAVVIFFGFSNVEKINRPLCSVLDENFNTFDTNTWTKNVSLGGFGNGEFQMTTDSSDNLYIKNGELYIMPTLTSDEIGASSIFDGYTYNLTGCTETWNASACNVRSDQGTNTVVNPVKSARISTQNSVSMAYGKVEVRAKMPRGDWLWPAIWMLPKDEKYGAWPRSGEIDIVEARGNSASYPRQGNNFVRGSLNWGPLDTVVANAFGWQFQKRSTYSSGFHTYTLEWTPDFIRISVDSKLRAMLDLNIKKTSFWERGGFPVTAQNGSTQAVVQDIWEGQPNAAPFDQEFYLIIDLAVGGTSGWFPDNVGGKMWFDGSATAMTDFAKAQDTWSATWPSSDDDRALRVDSVKMWKLC